MAPPYVLAVTLLVIGLSKNVNNGYTNIVRLLIV